MKPDQRTALQKNITDTAIEHAILSQWTAFVAVDATRHTDGTFGTTVHQPPPLPDGMKYPTNGGGKDD